MKAKILRSHRLALVLGGMVFATGGLQPFQIRAEDVPAEANAPTASAVTDEPAPPDAPSPITPVMSAPLSPTAAEVVKLAQAGMGDDVVLAYIGAARSHFSLGSDQIVYLNDVGISGAVVKAMIQRDAAIDIAIATVTNVPPAIVDTGIPNPPDEGPTAPPPPDTATTVATDNPGDYATTDDTSYFYDSLAPYGSWVYVSGAGLCWQPTVYAVDRSWRPYNDRGRWLYTDCGWYWQSDYSWGWAAFHYGRWFRDTQRGWVWAPNRVWGPAWVSWRHSADYCGWAPLPPAARFAPGIGFRVGNNLVGANFEFGLTAKRYTFIPIERMTDSAPGRYALLPGQAAEAYQNTTVINHYQVENHRVVSHGIDPQVVARASGMEVRQAQVQVQPRGNGKNIQTDRLARTGDNTVIYRPQLPRPDLNYTKKLPATASAPSTGHVTVIGGNSSAPRSPTTPPMILNGPNAPTLAAQARERNKYVIMVPPQLQNERPASAPLPAAAYPPNSLVWSGAQNNSMPTRPAGTYSPALPAVPDSTSAPEQPTLPANGLYYHGGAERHHNGSGDENRFNHDYNAPTVADPPRESRGPLPQNNYQPPQATILTPARPQYNGNTESRPASTYQAPAPVPHPSPILVPQSYSRPDPAPAPVISHPAPAESHSAPVAVPASHPSSPPPSSSSSSSSSSSNSGKR